MRAARGILNGILLVMPFWIALCVILLLAPCAPGLVPLPAPNSNDITLNR